MRASLTFRSMLMLMFLTGAIAGCGDDESRGDGTDGGILDTGVPDDGSQGEDGAMDAAPIPDPPPSCQPATDTCEDTGSTHTYVMRMLDLGRAQSGRLEGLNLDDEVTEEGGSTGCGVPDGISPYGDRGVDNALAFTPISSLLDEATLQDPVTAGDLLLIVQLSGVDGTGFENDDCVTLSILVGVAPAGATLDSDGDGLLDSGLTLGVDPASVDEDGEPLIQQAGCLRDGYVNVGPLDLALDLEVLGAPLTLNIRRSQMRFQASADELTEGVLGGALNVDELGALIAESEVPDGGMTYSADAVCLLVEGVTDLSPGAPETCPEENCQDVSSALVFDAVPATLEGGGAPSDGGMPDGG